MKPYPQARIDVAGLDPGTAHQEIVKAAREAFAPAGPDLVHLVPADVTEQIVAIGEGIRAILDRHEPSPGFMRRANCGHCDDRSETRVSWPCADYRDAARGLATGLPETDR